jgi:hypothetical protein
MQDSPLGNLINRVEQNYALSFNLRTIGPPALTLSYQHQGWIRLTPHLLRLPPSTTPPLPPEKRAHSACPGLPYKGAHTNTLPGPIHHVTVLIFIPTGGWGGGGGVWHGSLPT